MGLQSHKLPKVNKAKRFARFGLLWVGLIISSVCYAIEPTALPEISELENRIERVKSDSSTPEAQRLQMVESLQLAIKHLEQQKTFKAQAENFAKALKQAPAEQAKLERKIANHQRQELEKNLLDAPLGKLEAMLAKQQQTLTSSRSRLSVIDAQINQEKTLDTQSLLAETRNQLNKAIITQKGTTTGQTEDSAERLVANANIEMLQARVSLLEQRIFSREARLELLNTEKEWLLIQLADAEYLVAKLKDLISSHRQSDVERLVVSIRGMAEGISPDTAPFKVAEENISMAQDFKKLVSQQDDVLSQIEAVSRTANRFEQKYASLISQLKITQLESSSAFGAALRQQRDSHSDVEGSRAQLNQLEQALTNARLAQFQVDMAKEPDAMAAYASEQRAALATENGPELVKINSLLEQRENLLKELSNGYSSYIDDLSKLIAQLQTLRNSSQRYAELLNQQLLWMPSSEMIGLHSLTGTFKSILDIARQIDLSTLVKTVFERLTHYFFIALALLMLFIWYLKRAPSLKQDLVDMKSQVGKVQRDSIKLSLKALLITFVLSLPGPILMLAIAALLPQGVHPYDAMTEALKYTAVFYLALQFIIQSLRTDGLVGLHYKWDNEKRRIVRTNLLWLKSILIPLFIITLFAEFQDSAQVRTDLGRVSFIVAAMLSAFVAYRMFNPKQGILQPALSEARFLPQWQFNYLIFPLVVLPPVVLALMSFWGYHYTALQLSGYLLQSIGIVVGGIFLFYFTRRAISISERRLALERAKAKRAAMAAQSDDESAESASEMQSEAGPIVLDTESIDLQTISSHTEALLKMVLVVSVGFLMWGVWSELIRAFQRLDTISLWEVAEVVNGTSVATAITVWDLLLTAVVLVITYLAARNIPGLLEIAFLSRLSLQPGSNYAITTMTRYIIVISGVFIALQLLGAQWSKLQWLIAALSVGLGFGLQEIVANFVSGIVILFERPIRIGDTITVGDQFGTVSKIRIRATTIVDWDRREIIIPNKTFITERLVNWTLTDPIMRTTISVGVAYGSDVELVEKSLMEIAEANEKVLEDPEPVALFRTFGDSTLNFQLRVFIKGIQELNPVIHEIHVAIDKLFRERNIEIAFPQRSLHFDAKPLEVKLISDHDAADKK